MGTPDPLLSESRFPSFWGRNKSAHKSLELEGGEEQTDSSSAGFDAGEVLESAQTAGQAAPPQEADFTPTMGSAF